MWRFGRRQTRAPARRGAFNNRSLEQRAPWAIGDLAAEHNIATIDLHYVCSERLRNLTSRPDSTSQLEPLAREHVGLAKKTLKAFQEDYQRQCRFYGRMLGAEAQVPPLQLPDHPGYTLLATLFEQKGQIRKAIELCVTARNQGWSGDWDERLHRLEYKLQRS